MTFVICEQLWHLSFVNNREAWMPIFDNSITETAAAEIYTRDEVLDGKTIHVLGL